ncbi:MAG: zinc-dependent alcohol dehydrogenase family protein [Waterburya sp.]
MKAFIIENFGALDSFHLTDLPMPELLPNHVLIKVAATSVNPVDTKIRQGLVPNIAPDFPAVLHGDVAGVIEAVGNNVNAFKVGDEIYGCAGGVKGTVGALAEYMLADSNLIAHKPMSLTMAEAAALPLVSITAWEGLIDRAHVQSGQKILVYGGTGGVGHLGIQLAKWAGAEVYATVSSSAKEAIALSLGADVAINYHDTAVEEFVTQYTDGQGFDLIFDTVGNDNLQNAFQAVKLNGTVISTVSTSQQDLSLMHAKGLTLHLVYMLLPMLSGINRAHHGKILTQLAQLVDQGQVRPLLDHQTFNFSEVAAAHAHLESRQAIGKIVLTNE